MIDYGHEAWQKRKALLDKLSLTETEKKGRLLGRLSQESSSLISLAYMYAVYFEKTGMDVTKVYENAQEQKAKWQEIYNKGYEDGYFERQKRL